MILEKLNIKVQTEFVWLGIGSTCRFVTDLIKASNFFTY